MSYPQPPPRPSNPEVLAALWAMGLPSVASYAASQLAKFSLPLGGHYANAQLALPPLIVVVMDVDDWRDLGHPDQLWFSP